MQTPSQLTPEQVAELQLARGPGGQQTSFAGNVDLQAPAPPGFRQQAREVIEKGKSTTRRTIAGAQGKAQDFLKRYPNAGKYGIAAVGAASLIPGVTTAISELEAGRPTGAVGALAPGLLSAAGTGLAMIKNPVAQVAGYGLMGLGALLPGAGAAGLESARQSATGKPTKGKEGEFSTQLAMRGQLAEQDLTTLDRELGVRLGYMRDLNRDASNQAFLDLQRMNPLLQKMKNADLIRQQALLNTQGNIQANLGVLATAGALAKGAQAETGATTRTALQANPYANSVLQAPSISFG